MDILKVNFNQILKNLSILPEDLLLGIQLQQGYYESTSHAEPELNRSFIIGRSGLKKSRDCKRSKIAVLFNSLPNAITVNSTSPVHAAVYSDNSLSSSTSVSPKLPKFKLTDNGRSIETECPTVVGKSEQYSLKPVKQQFDSSISKSSSKLPSKSSSDSPSKPLSKSSNANDELDQLLSIDTKKDASFKTDTEALEDWLDDLLG